MTDFKKLLFIGLGAFLIALSAVWFADRAGLVTGGATGIAIAIRELGLRFGVEIHLFLTNIIVNVPLFIIIFFKKGAKFLTKSLYATILLSIFLWVAEYIPNILYVGDDFFIAAIMTGIFMGVGLGLVIRYGATTGGTDLFAEILKCGHPEYKLSLIINITDMVIIFLGLFIFGPVKALYACLAVFVATFIMDKIITGGTKGKAALIFSDECEAVACALSQKLNRGMTFFYAKGYYSDKDKKVLMSVVTDKEIVKLKNIVYETDKEAFIIIDEVTEVIGKGFSI